MNIFLNLLAGTTGGQITRARAFLDRVEQFAPDIQLIVVKDNHVLKEYKTIERRLIIDVSIGQGKLKALKRILWENTVMPRLIKQYESDIFLTFSHYLPFKKLKVPTLVGISNLAPFSALALKEESLASKIKFGILKRTILLSAGRADSVIALSQTAEKVLISNGIDQMKIKVIHIGVDKFWSDSLNDTSSLLQMGISKPFFLYVSHFYRYKNHLRLIKAFSTLPTRIKDNNQLVLVGKPEDKAYFDEIVYEIRKNGLEKNVLLIPGEGMEVLRCLYQRTSLFIFPSLVENCPNILLEAMAAGAPIATVDIEPMNEYCQVSAEYFEGTNINSIANTIIKLVDDSRRIDEMRMLSHIKAKSYSWNNFVSNVVAETRSLYLKKK